RNRFADEDLPFHSPVAGAVGDDLVGGGFDADEEVVGGIENDAAIDSGKGGDEGKVGGIEDVGGRTMFDGDERAVSVDGGDVAALGVAEVAGDGERVGRRVIGEGRAGADVGLDQV